LILLGKVHKIFITHKDRLLRFGNEIIFYLCSQKQAEVVILKKSMVQNTEQELANDIIEIMTVFCAKVYGHRSAQNRIAA
jgi:putative resolvase